MTQDLRSAAELAREALENAQRTLEVASRILTDAHRIVLNGNQWGESTLKRIPKAIAALTSALEAREWRTMESAPRDQRILLYAPGDPYSLPDLISVCEWHPDAGFCICELREPTHWRPLPPPPQGERE